MASQLMLARQPAALDEGHLAGDIQRQAVRWRFVQPAVALHLRAQVGGGLRAARPQVFPAMHSLPPWVADQPDETGLAG
ncbi:hypothetical protein D9M71_841820 [compost metagenome]